MIIEHEGGPTPNPRLFDLGLVTSLVGIGLESFAVGLPEFLGKILFYGGFGLILLSTQAWLRRDPNRNGKPGPQASPDFSGKVVTAPSRTKLFAVTESENAYREILEWFRDWGSGDQSVDFGMTDPAGSELFKGHFTLWDPDPSDPRHEELLSLLGRDAGTWRVDQISA